MLNMTMDELRELLRMAYHEGCDGTTPAKFARILAVLGDYRVRDPEIGDDDSVMVMLAKVIMIQNRR